MSFYENMYSKFNFNGIKFGDYISGESKAGVKFRFNQLSTVGGGTLGVWVDDIPIELNPENGGDVIIKETIQLEKKATKEEKEYAGRCPRNEIMIQIK